MSGPLVTLLQWFPVWLAAGVLGGFCAAHIIDRRNKWRQRRAKVAEEARESGEPGARGSAQALIDQEFRAEYARRVDACLGTITSDPYTWPSPLRPGPIEAEPRAPGSSVVSLWVWYAARLDGWRVVFHKVKRMEQDEDRWTI